MPESAKNYALRFLVAYHSLTENTAFLGTTMLHRHLNHQTLTLAAIDDVIGRGKVYDWADLRSAVLRDRTVREKVFRVCQAHVHDPYAQRYHFWKHYVEQHAA
ncbi:hypothetical protein [Acidiferrobacter thiooxydans]|nr:hypothetical protein [Acidiferrobacter thiooxydans]UEO01180.1 hypothetical protein A9R16_007225 [Acidiferrobacter thiooxydans]